MDIQICDLETDGLNAKEIFVVGIIDYKTDEYIGYTGDDIPEGLLRLSKADYIIGHNYRGFDAKVIKKLTEGLVTIPPVKIIDTLDYSRALFPKMPSHKLKDWGLLFDYPKIEFNDFSKFTPEMNTYCEQDCRITKRMIDFFRTVSPDIDELFDSF